MVRATMQEVQSGPSGSLTLMDQTALDSNPSTFVKAVFSQPDYSAWTACPEGIGPYKLCCQRVSVHCLCGTTGYRNPNTNYISNALSAPGHAGKNFGDVIFGPAALPMTTEYCSMPSASASELLDNEYPFPCDNWTMLPPTPRPSVYSPEILPASGYQSDTFEAVNQDSASSCTTQSPTLEPLSQRYQWRPFIYRQGGKVINPETEAQMRSERRKQQNRRAQRSYRKRQEERAATFQAQAEANYEEVKKLLNTQHELNATIMRLQSEIEILKERSSTG